MKQMLPNSGACSSTTSLPAIIFTIVIMLGSFLSSYGQNINTSNTLKIKPLNKIILNQQSKKNSSANISTQKGAAASSSISPSSAIVAATYNFTPSTLVGTSLANPTSLQFGPDSRLYVSEQPGAIKAYTIIRDSANHYTVTATEQIDLINTIPNHNDDGQINSTVTNRQITGILLKGTASNPVIYVSSSDKRVGGPNGSLNLDTNSGIISMLTWNGSQWVKLDLVRGLPRSEENHASNGMQLDDKTNILYLAQGGNTNAGSPSHDFDYTCEYALSAAILSINLNVIKSMPVKGSGNSAYVYDLPTLDDPTRANNTDGTDVNDPFGGNNGLNQAKIVVGGPVQVYSPGYRNPFDLIITRERNMYTIDNGANQGWGGYPQYEGTDTVNNNYVVGEPGSTGPSATQLQINNLDNLHFIGNVDTYVPGSFYGGHPNPIRANPYGAGLYTVAANDSFFRTSKTGTHPLPVDWPPVAKANPIEGRFKMPGVADGALLTFQTSSNGIAQYNASNFNGALKGSLLACGFRDVMYKINLTADGTNVTNTKGSSTLNMDAPFAANFASNPLDITIQDDSTLFAGTIWVTNYGSRTVTIFEPSDFNTCTGAYDNADDDKDHYTNMDELDNGTDPCSASSIPPDNDHDFISDLNDPDDDNDGKPDISDFFAIDANNGLSTTIPISYDFLNNDPGTGFFGVGFTGLMTNYKTDYGTLFNKANLIVGGAVGAFSIINVTPGDALGNLNTQENAFQFGIKTVNTLPFTIVGSLLGPFFNHQTPQNYQSQGIYIGNGDQDNYLKITLNANGGPGGIEVVYENAGVPVSTQYPLIGGNLSSSTIVLYLMVDPLNGTVQPQYAINKGQVMNVGAPIPIGGLLLSAIKSVYAVGIIATSRGGLPFTASWDYFYIANTPTANAGPDVSIANNTVVLNGSGSDVLGSIKGFLWNQAGGPNTAIFSPGNLIANPTLTGLIPGTYTFTLTVTDSLRAISKPDTMLVTVTAFLNANAGSDTLITAPANSAVLHGSGSSIYPINSFSWTQVSGPNTAIFSPDNKNQNPTAGGLIQGVYTFALVITDSVGSVSKPDSVIVSIAANGGVATQVWQTLTPASGAIIGREENGYVQAGNKFYLLGGRAIAAVQEYDPAVKSWVNKSSPPVELNHFQPVTFNGLTYIVGAMNGPYPHEVPLPNVYVYNAASDKWATGATIPVNRRRGGGAAVVYNNKIYLICGITDGHWAGWVNWLDEYDPATNTWKIMPDAPRTRDHVQAQVINNKLYVAGGRRSSASTGDLYGQTVPEVDVFDFASATWSTLPAGSNLPIPRAGAATIAVANQLIVIGGESGLQSASHSETHALDVTSNTWVRLADLQTGRHGTGAVYSGNGIYTASGPSLRGGTSLTTSQEAYYTAPPSTNYGSPLMQDQLSAVTNINFSGIATSTSSSKIIPLTNTGSGQDILITSITQKNGVSAFTYTTPYPLPFTITAGSTVNITITFLPQSTVNQTDTLIIAHTGQNASLSIMLNGQVGNLIPTANAGADKSVILPVTSTVLNGSGMGSYPIISYNWKQVSGPNTAAFSPNNTTASPTLNGLTQGAYLFTLNVTDSLGTISQPDSVNVSVAAAGTITQVWQTLTPSSGAIIGREENGYVQAGNRFYLLGGRAIVNAQEYDPAAKSWVNKSSPPVELNHFQPVTYNGLTYVIGAMNGPYPHEVPLPNVYVYNAASDKWLTGATIPVNRRRGAGAAVVYNNKIYLICGITDGHWAGWVNWFDEYDPATNTWKVLANAPHLRDHVQAQVINNKLYVAGGRRSSASTGDLYGLTVPEVDVYDFAGATWSTLPAASNLPIPRAGAATIAAGNQLVVIGGESGLQSVSHNETHALDVTTNTWQKWANLQTGRHGTGAVFSGNGIYTASGPSLRGGTSLLTNQELYYTAAPTTNYGTPLAQDQLTTPASLYFVGVAVNTSGSKIISLTNTGAGQDILITSLGITGSTTFTYITPYPLPFTIPAGQTVNITVVYKPTTTTVQTGNLVVMHSGQNNTNTIALNGQVGNINPVADAGPNRAITLPVNSLVITGAGSGPNAISSYSWKTLGGPNVPVYSPNNTVQSPTISGLIAGNYTFALTVKDNQLLVSKPDTVMVTVNGANSGISYTLVNAANNQDIVVLKEGNVLNLATLPSTRLNVRANINSSTVKSFVFDLTGAVVRKQIEGSAPYALFGDNSGVYNSWIPPVGYYTLKGTPYPAANGTGTAATSLTLNFSVVNKSGIPAVSSITDNAFLKVKEKFNANTKNISAYPNPSTDGRFTVFLPKDLAGEVSYSLVSMNGEKLVNAKLQLAKATSSIDFDFSQEMVSPGVYYLNIDNKTLKSQCKLSKIK